MQLLRPAPCRPPRHLEATVISRELLDILACPACEERPAVHLSDDGRCLVCSVCGRRYPVQDDIPVMLVDAALPPESAPAAPPAPTPPQTAR